MRFGNFEFDSVRPELRRDGRVVALHSQPARLLTLFVERAGELVTRDEIRRHLWPDESHLEFDQGINTCVRQVRLALGDSPDSPRFLATVPRHGYRFIAEVEASTPPLAGNDRRGVARLWVVGLGLASTLAAVAVLVVLFARGDVAEDASGGRPRLVVLPFQTLGAGPDESYFADAMTEELIAYLGRNYPQRISVIARTSAMRYRGGEATVREIAEELEVDFLVEGSVQHSAGKLRVTAQLIATRDESHLWSQTFDHSFTEPLLVQRQVAGGIAHALALEVLPADPIRRTMSPAAYDALLRGRHHLSKNTADGYARARGAFEEALRHDPDLAEAHLGMARVELLTTSPPEGGQRARRSVHRALSLDDSLAGAHHLLSSIRLYSDYDLEGARASFERALELDPSRSEVHHDLAAYYSIRGRHDEAIASVERARAMDPVAADVNSDVGWYYYFARRYDEAIEHSLRTLELEPDYYWAVVCLQLSRFAVGDRVGVMQATQQRLADADGAPGALLALDDPDRFHEEFWNWQLQRLEAYSADQFVAPSRLAVVQMLLGQHEGAIDNLERSFAMRAGWIVPFLPVHPLFDPVREDPRFAALVERIGAGAGAGGGGDAGGDGTVARARVIAPATGSDRK